MATIGESSHDDEGVLGVAEWLKSEKVAEFQRQMEAKIVRSLFQGGPENAQFIRMVQTLAWMGASSDKRPSLQKEVIALNGLNEDAILPCGLGRNLRRVSSKVGRFIADHKTEILIGVAMCATGVGLAVATGYTCSAVVGGVVVAGAGSIFNKEEPPKHPPMIPPTPSREAITLSGQSPFSPLPRLDFPSSETELLVTPEGIWANGQFYSNQDLMQKSHFAKELSTLVPPSEWTIAQKEALSESLSAPVAVAAPCAQKSPSYEGTKVPQSGAAVFGGGTEPLISIPFRIEGKRSSGACIAWINGVNNTFAESKASASYIQTLSGGQTIFGVYNCTHGPFVDILEAALLNHQGYSPNTALLLQHEWKAFHEANMDRPNAKLLQICHSQGAIDVKNALIESPIDIQDRVIVIAIAPGAVVPKRLCFKSYNYASEKDFVYKLEPPPARPVRSLTIDDVLVPTFGETMDDHEELMILVSHPEAEGIDHAFQSATYQPLLYDILDDYRQHQGEYLPEENGR